MEPDNMEKQMSSTNRKGMFKLRLEKIFNVRRIHYKQYEHEKCKFTNESRFKTTFFTLPEKDTDL